MRLQLLVQNSVCHIPKLTWTVTHARFLGRDTCNKAPGVAWPDRQSQLQHMLCDLSMAPPPTPPPNSFGFSLTPTPMLSPFAVPLPLQAHHPALCAHALRTCKYLSAPNHLYADPSPLMSMTIFPPPHPIINAPNTPQAHGAPHPAASLSCK